MAGDSRHLHDPEKAAEFARALGLMVGGAGHPFVGDWGVKGLYAYHSGKYKGIAYFGTGGSERDRLTMPHESEKYRPWNRYDPDIPAHIRKKLVELEDDDSTSIGQYPQSATTPFTGGMLQGENILVSKHSLPKYNGIYTIQNNEINGKPWFKNNSGCILYFYNANSGGGPSWSLDDRPQDGTNDWFRGGWIEPPNSGGPPLGTRSWAILETHRRFEIKMESVSIPDESDEPILNSDNGMLQGEISLKSVHGKYLNATPEGRAQWDDDVAHVGEYFRVEQRQNGKIALMSAFDMYVSAQPDGSVEINRREAPPGGWEEFTVEYRSNDVVCLKSCHGKYLSAQQDGTAQWNRDHAPIGGWEEIQIEQYRETSEPILSESIPNSDLKYVFAHEHMDWHWHNDRARAMGGHIASVTSAKENEDITRISGGAPVWLGGIRKGARYRGKPLAVADRKPGDPGEVGPGAEDWYWSDDRPWSYTNWGPGEPNNWDGGENRVQHLGKFGAVWNDVGEDWDGPAVYRIPAKSTPPSATVPRDQSTDTVKLNPGISDEVDAEPNKRLANTTFVIGITLFIFGLPLVIIGAISTAEDRLAMLVPGAIIMSMGVFVLMRALFIFIYSGSKPYVETNKQTQIEVLSFNHRQPIRFRIISPPNDKKSWVGIYPSGANDKDHGGRWIWLEDMDINDASFPEQEKGKWSIRVFSNGRYKLHQRVEFEVEADDKNEVWMHDARHEDGQLIGQVHYGNNNQFTKEITTDNIQSHRLVGNVNRFETQNTIYLVYEHELGNEHDDELFWKI